MLVDPSLNMIDISYDNFNGLTIITTELCLDLASILETEYIYYQYSSILDYAFRNKLTTKQMETLNRISEIMKSINADNISKLQEIYNNNPQIQFTDSIRPPNT